MEQEELKRLASRMYCEIFQRLEDPRMREVVNHKVTAMYGPPMVRPDVALVSFQGGGGDDSPSRRTWPGRLLYLDDHFAFGRTLRRQFDDAGLDEVLRERTVAMAACFPEARTSESGRWTSKSGPRAEWREFSSAWVRRMLAAMRPRAVLVFGTKASLALGLEERWRNVEQDSRGWRAFGRATIEDCPAVYCQHLSQGWMRRWVQMSLREVACLVRKRLGT